MTNGAKPSHQGMEMLPPGRHRRTWEDLRDAYCPTTQFGQSRRQLVWEHFELATQTLRSVVPVAGVWVGGSFLTSKQEPGDIDAVYIVRAKAYDLLTDDSSRRTVALFAGDEQLKARGILVDSYVIQWAPRSTNGLITDQDHAQLLSRGYWDDWLQRHKEDRGTPPTDQDSFPVRGYVEVVLDGFATD
jgi:hypothetical protein